MICRQYGKRRDRIRKNCFCLRQVRGDRNILTQFRKQKTGDRGYWKKEVLVAGERQTINHRNIFLGIAHRDFNVDPIVWQSVLFVSLEKSLIYYMYDDRGLLIISSSKESLPVLPPNLNILGHEEHNFSELWS